jgi:signal recognition particle receptor subunit beta
VYYGPGLSGKTTNLLYVHKKVPATTRGKMISLATEADRTLYFDFLPINIGAINGFAAKFQLYTVPGQVYYNATRKLVLRGADGLVFVADSQAEKMDENIESLTNLRENLEEYGYSIDEIPIVMQYNKRDLPGALPISELEAKLNPHGWKWFEAEAVTGKGVFDTLKMIIKLVLEKAKSGRSAPQPVAKEAAGLTEKAPPASGSLPANEPTPAPREEATASPVRQTVYEPESASSPQYEEEAEPERQVEYGTLSEGKIDAEIGDAPVREQPPHEIKQEEPIMVGDGAGQRPFPGSTTSRILRRERRISVSDFQPATRGEEGVFRGGLGDDKGIPGGAAMDLPKPTMAPAQRIVKKKAGFFKRLFGIK